MSPVEANEPRDHEIEATSITSRPTAPAPPSRPSGPITSTRPPRPIAAASTVARATRSPATRRQTTTCSGTEPAIIAATPESIRVSATWTSPTPNESSATPTPAAEMTSRREARSERPRSARMPASTAAAATNLVPAVSSGGSVRTASLIARYVEPQTR